MATFNRTVLQNQFLPHKPTQRQANFLLHNDTRDVFYGGAAGGGKSDALLMAACQYVHVPTYSALILRRSYTDLALPGAIMDRAISWWHNKHGAKWNQQKKQFTFPSGATITFGYLGTQKDVYRYQSAEFQFIGFDELTQFTATQFTFMFSRLRRNSQTQHVPLRMRSASNPPASLDGAWVKHRYLTKACVTASREQFFGQTWWNQDRCFIPARMEDNPHLDQASYRQSLSNLDTVTKAQLETGDWSAHANGRFHRSWFGKFKDIGDALIVGEGYYGASNLVHKSQLAITMWVDPANRKKRESKNTCILVVGQDTRGRLFVLDVVCEQLDLTEQIPRLYQLALRWKPMRIGFESNGFQMHLVNEAHDRTRYPHMPTIKEVEPEGKSKLTRATPAINKACQGEIFVLDGDPAWLEPWFAELELFTGDDTLDVYTDRVDTLAYAVLDQEEQFTTAAPTITMAYQ
jgi:hypothetical protein